MFQTLCIVMIINQEMKPQKPAYNIFTPVYNLILSKQTMLNKLLGRKDKGLDIFNIPDKKYCHDAKKLSKMEKKDLLDQIEHMEKYISNVCGKLEDGRKQCEKFIQRLDETTEKLNVVNSRMANINNQHEQLLVKFQNLQQSLEFMTKQKQDTFKSQVKFIEAKQLSRQKITDFNQVLKIYKDQIELIDKIVYQNKQSKQKYIQLEIELENLTKKLEESKTRSQNEEHNEVKISGKSREQTEPDEDKNNQLKLLLQTKQQMILIQNKKIQERDERIAELQQKIEDLNHEINKRSTELKQKDENICRYHNQIQEYKRKITQIKQFETQLLQNEDIYKQQIKEKQEQIEKCKKQIIEMQHKLQLSEEEKKILIGGQNQIFSSSEQTQKQFEIEKKKFQHAIQVKQRQIANLYNKFEVMIKQKNQLEVQVGNHRTKLKQVSKLQQSYLEQTKKIEDLQKKLQDQQQNYQIKLKKLQFNFNQERIKAEALKRSLTQTEQKQEEQRKQLDEIYEKKIAQDSKMVKLQGKVKHYKQMIQYLQKQKVEMQKTYQDKMKNMEQIVLHEAEEEENNNNNEVSQNSERDIIQKDQAIINKLHSKIVDLEEQLNFLKQENKNLANKRNQLEQSNLQLTRNFKTMNDKRQEMMRQFSKMNSLDNIIPMKVKPDQKAQNMVPNREKKVAQKALKGFDIMSKHLSHLYKDFLNVHITDINKKQIKQMQGSINTLVGKCEDMKDIFQGYL